MLKSIPSVATDGLLYIINDIIEQIKKQKPDNNKIIILSGVN